LRDDDSFRRSVDSAWLEVFASSVEFSRATFHKVGTFAFSVDDRCGLPLLVEGVVRIDWVTRLKRLGVVVGVSIVLGCLLLLTFQVRLTMEIGLRMVRGQSGVRGR
jgi:hypothetical protein